MTGNGGMEDGNARARALRGRYRAAPRVQAIRGDDMTKCLLMMAGLVTLMMLIAFT